MCVCISFTFSLFIFTLVYLHLNGLFCSNYPQSKIYFISAAMKYKDVFFNSNTKFYFGSQINIEAATGSVLLKKVFLKISQMLQENTCVRVSF